MLTDSWVQMNPSVLIPEIILQYEQASGAFDLLATRDPIVRLSEGDLYVYMKYMDIRTKIQAAQSASNNLPSIDVSTYPISTPTYLLQVNGIYDHHDGAAMARWGASIEQVQRLGMRQGIFQQLRNMLLYGMNPSQGEGLTNATGVTAVNLPPDFNGNDTVLTYDNGAMSLFFLAQLAAIKSRTNQLGTPVRVEVLGPQRVLSVFEYQGIVQVTQYQRPGAGTESTKGVIKNVATENGDTFGWGYDDTLIGKGAGGTDLVIISVPEINKPKGMRINTNEFALVAPGMDGCNVMYTDMPAPREIPSPASNGAIQVLSEMRSTSGWSIRPDPTTLISMQYS